MGPFALADMVGIDIQHSVMESVFAQFYGEPAFAPMNLSALRVAGGLLGRKTGAGWFSYEDGKAVDAAGAARADRREPKSVWVRPSEHHPDLQAPLIDLFKQAGVDDRDAAQAERRCADRADADRLGPDHGRASISSSIRSASVAVDVLFGMKGPRTLMVTPATDPVMRDAAHGLLAADGQPVIVINDSPGFVAQRVVAMIVNIGCGVAQRGIATPADIDKGTKLGLGYPFGPHRVGRPHRRRARAAHPGAAARVLRRAALPAQPVAQAPRRCWACR